jgi:hypothetical protein
MPNINEFFNKPERLDQKDLERIDGIRPCSKCDKNAKEGFWDPHSMQLSWTCPDGHHTIHTIA